MRDGRIPSALGGGALYAIFLPAEFQAVEVKDAAADKGGDHRLRLVAIGVLVAQDPRTGRKALLCGPVAGPGNPRALRSACVACVDSKHARAFRLRSIARDARNRRARSSCFDAFDPQGVSAKQFVKDFGVLFRQGWQEPPRGQEVRPHGLDGLGLGGGGDQPLAVVKAKARVGRVFRLLVQNGDFLIFSQANENRILLNMGGIANFTFLPATLEPNDVFATDTGTGNTLLDAFVQKIWGIPYDKDAQLARQGTVSQPLLTQLKSHPFFQQSFPKTTGPELFNLAYLNEALQKIRETPTDQDILATLVQFSADTIVDAIEKMQYKLPTGFSTVLYASGGGMHNPLLMERIREQLAQFPILPLNDLGISGDAKEAVLFATLANEALVGGKTDFGTRQGVPSVSMGKISFPN